MSEKIYKVVNKNGDAVSGYNNPTGLFTTRRGAGIAKGYQERLNRRFVGYGREDSGPFKIVSGTITWGERGETDNADHR